MWLMGAIGIIANTFAIIVLKRLRDNDVEVLYFTSQGNKTCENITRSDQRSLWPGSVWSEVTSIWDSLLSGYFDMEWFDPNTLCLVLSGQISVGFGTV